MLEQCSLAYERSLPLVDAPPANDVRQRMLWTASDLLLHDDPANGVSEVAVNVEALALEAEATVTIWRKGVVACVLLSIAVHGVNAQATPPQPQPQPPEYQTLIDRALAEYEAHNFAEARALFNQAHALYPNARTLRGLGMVSFELKTYGESIRYLEAALTAQVKPLTGELRDETLELLARAKAFVARYEIEIKPEPPSLQIVVDGIPVEFAPGQGLTLSVGEHVLQVQAPRYQEEKRALSVKGGEAVRIVIELKETPAAPRLATSAQPQRDERSVWSSPWLWTGVGAVVVGGVLTAVLLSSGGTKTSAPISGDIGGVVQTLGLK